MINEPMIIGGLIALAALLLEWGHPNERLTAAWYAKQLRRIFRMDNYDYTTVDSRVFVIKNDIGQGFIDILPDSYQLRIHGFDTTFTIMDHRPLDEIKELFNSIQSSLNPNFAKDLDRDVANLPTLRKFKNAS